MNNRKDILRITKWLHPELKVYTKHGTLTNHEWLIKEQFRFQEPTEIRTKEGPFFEVMVQYEALFRVSIYDIPVFFQDEKL